MYNHTTLRTSPLQRSRRRRTVGAEPAMKRTTLGTRAAAVAIAAALGAAACGADTEPNQAAITVPAPPPTTTAEPTAPVTTAVPPPTTAAPDDPAPVTTEAQPDTYAEKPQVTIWSTPRLLDSTLSASWACHTCRGNMHIRPAQRLGRRHWNRVSLILPEATNAAVA